MAEVAEGGLRKRRYPFVQVLQRIRKIRQRAQLRLGQQVFRIAKPLLLHNVPRYAAQG